MQTAGHAVFAKNIQRIRADSYAHLLILEFELICFHLFKDMVCLILLRFLPSFLIK